ncbi:MAG: RlmE family RNA methyltransferase [Gammaproteobacteria bacterium]|jgi:23S rRNA (uridine2552-2'-O)-methyltransferase|nr:RlmE family RNA methyltransferase [Gammaproteobacteria bacterium]
MSRWHERQQKDIYIKKRASMGYRSRASFKLEQLNQRYHLIKNGSVVVELGSAPGGWSQVLSRLNPRGVNIACDLLTMDPVARVDFIQGDFLEKSVQVKMAEILNGQQISLLLSDLAPNLTGNRVVDQARCYDLCDNVLGFGHLHLVEGGALLIKVFHGQGFDDFLKTIRVDFKQVHVLKPDASRSESREVYILGIGFVKRN